jgi:hypothetical protein
MGRVDVRKRGAVSPGEARAAEAIGLILRDHISEAVVE